MWEHIRGVQVKVPATSANLGPGFDVLGLALALYNTFTVTPSDSLRIEINGHSASLPLDETNLFYQAFSFLFKQTGPVEVVPSVHITMDLDIPSGSGLGSSATAVVGGLVAANSLLGCPYSNETLVSHAVHLEHGNHADNVAPALLGSLVVNTYDPADGSLVSLKIPFPDDLCAVLLIPDFEMDTVQGRSLLPLHYSKQETVYNTSRVALLLSALQTRRYDLLRIAMQDKMHQPARAHLFPAMPALIAAALDAGAYGACLSGGGSSILALTSHKCAERVGHSLLSTGRAAGLNGNIRTLNIDREGAKATLL